MSLENEQKFNPNLVETYVKLIGDKRPIAQTVKLLAYIRHALRNNLKTEITVKIGGEIANVDYLFEVNGQQIDDYITQKKIEIN